jgi:hypothetical protein
MQQKELGLRKSNSEKRTKMWRNFSFLKPGVAKYEWTERKTP